MFEELVLHSSQAKELTHTLPHHGLNLLSLLAAGACSKPCVVPKCNRVTSIRVVALEKSNRHRLPPKPTMKINNKFTSANGSDSGLSRNHILSGFQTLTPDPLNDCLLVAPLAPLPGTTRRGSGRRPLGQPRRRRRTRPQRSEPGVATPGRPDLRDSCLFEFVCRGRGGCSPLPYFQRVVGFVSDRRESCCLGNGSPKRIHSPVLS